MNGDELYDLENDPGQERSTFGTKNSPSAEELLNVLRKIPDNHWGGFQLYYPMFPEEIKESTGPDLVDAMIAVFVEVTPLMNACMGVQLNLTSD